MPLDSGSGFQLDPEGRWQSAGHWRFHDRDNSDLVRSVYYPFHYHHCNPSHYYHSHYHHYCNHLRNDNNQYNSDNINFTAIVKHQLAGQYNRQLLLPNWLWRLHGAVLLEDLQQRQIAVPGR